MNAVASAPDLLPLPHRPQPSSAQLADYDYELPPELIATQPAPSRDQSRLLLLEHRQSDAPDGMAGCRHQRFAELPELISQQVGERTLIVLNDSKVMPARLHGHKLRSDGTQGGQVELLLTEPLPPLAEGQLGWRALYRCSKPLRAGQIVRLQRQLAEGGTAARDVQVMTADQGVATIHFGRLRAEQFSQLLAQIGEVPLPPYIESARLRDGQPRSLESDRRRYQTVFARAEGSVAAPTAGLHFTEELLARLRAAGHEIAYVTLHVGPGTFMPLRSDRIEQHVMHSERYQISSSTALAINAAKAAGRPVLAVGTTVVRTLEAAARPGGAAGELIQPCEAGETQIFIYPPYRFAVVDALLTNFHLPRSTLLMLVAAFAGRERILAAYAEAVAARYRFYSFGDAMLIPRPWAAAAD